LTSRSDDLSIANTDDSDQGLSIEDLASGPAAQLLLDDDEEEEEESGEEQGVEPKDKSAADLGGTSALSQGLSQASDKVDMLVIRSVLPCKTCQPNNPSLLIFY
jgi:hypothetical protein